MRNLLYSFDQVHMACFDKDICIFGTVIVKVLEYLHIVDDEVELATLILILFNILFGRVIIIQKYDNLLHFWSIQY